jgi:hypothetical protein
MSKMTILAEFWEFLKYRKKFWLLPIVVVLVTMVLLIASTPTAAIPFIYPF